MEVKSAYSHLSTPFRHPPTGTVQSSNVREVRDGQEQSTLLAVQCGVVVVVSRESYPGRERRRRRSLLLEHVQLSRRPEETHLSVCDFRSSMTPQDTHALPFWKQTRRWRKRPQPPTR